MGILELANSLVDTGVMGRGLKFPMTIDPATNDFQLVEAEENVKECVFWIIATRVGERVMNEDMGTLVTSALFRDIESLEDALPFQIADALDRYEPRITNVRVRMDRTGPTELRAMVTWLIRATGRSDNMVYPYYTDAPAGGS